MPGQTVVYDALTSLFTDPITLQKDAGGRTPAFTNGQQRVQAMRDAGVARTVIGTDVVVPIKIAGRDADQET